MVGNVQSLIRQLDATAALRDPVIREAIEVLQLPRGSRGLDAGCGIGIHSVLLAEEVGPDGRVTGLDVSNEVLADAEEVVTRRGLGDRVELQRGNVNALPFDDGFFDWAWSVDCVGHVSVGDPAAGVRELARVVRPGGTVAILLYSSQLLLPGFQELEARLNATVSAMTAIGEGRKPEHHFMRALGWFDEAGLREITVRTLAGTVQAPLDEDIRDGLFSLIWMLWGVHESRMTDEDREEFRRLTRRESQECLFVAPDYCGFFTYSMFSGQVETG